MTTPSNWLPPMRLGRRTLWGLAAGTAALPLVSCAPGGSSAPPRWHRVHLQHGQPDPASMGDVTITAMDTWTDKTAMQAQWITQVNTDFQAKYPNITIDRKTATFDDINKTLKLKLSDPSTPDVVPANNGWQGIGTFAEAGLILNLDAYAKAYGWDTRIAKTIAKQHTMSADSNAIGTGAFYGMPIAQGGFITVYYNRAKLSSLGLSVPTTFEEFEAALAKAKSAGEVPMMIGTQDQWLSTTTLFAVMNVFGEKDKIADFVYGISGSAADTGMVEAATAYQKWSQADYLPKNFAGTSGSDSGPRSSRERASSTSTTAIRCRSRPPRWATTSAPSCCRRPAATSGPPGPPTRTSRSPAGARTPTPQRSTWTTCPARPPGRPR